MRVVACAFVALALGTIASGPAAAQYHGPEYEDQRSGPPRYYTDRPTSDGRRQSFDRPPNDGPRQNFERPPYRGEPDRDEPRQNRAGDARSRPWPAASNPGERRPDPSYRRAGPVTPSDNYRRFWDDRDDRPARPTVNRPPAPRDAPPYQRVAKPRVMPQAPRTAAGPGKVTISVAEYRALQDQARELQRLLGRRSDLRDGPRRDLRDGPRRDFRDGPRGDFRDRDMRPGGGIIYR